MKEIPLKGGRSTDGVVRVGDTLRRPHKQESEFANSVLKYLEKQGYPYSQRYFGLDECGRDTFAFIDGYVPSEIGNTTLAQLCAFMKIVKDLHDVSSGFAPEGKVICHNDLSPCNTVFRNDVPVAIIDWDSAAFGERWEDLTYILWLWINIGSHKRTEIDIMGQMKSALAVYRADEQTLRGFADKLIWRMDKVIADMTPENYQYKRTKDWVNKIAGESRRKSDNAHCQSIKNSQFPLMVCDYRNDTAPDRLSDSQNLFSRRHAVRQRNQYRKSTAMGKFIL